MSGEELKEQRGMGPEVEGEFQDEATVTAPAQDAPRPEPSEDRSRFDRACEQVLSEDDEVFRRLADA